MLIESATRKMLGGETTVSILRNEDGIFHTVTVIHRFDSGNFVKETPHYNLSLVAAQGLLKFFTS